MIIIKLTSGLGNQMFQYAAARRLAHKHNTIVKLDIDSFGQNKLRSYALSHFNIREDFASAKDILPLYPLEGINRFFIRKVLGKKISYKFNNLIEKKIKKTYYHFNPSTDIPGKLLHGKVLAQRYFHFDPEIMKAPDNCYMIGFFQSEKFFKDIDLVIREDFQFKTIPDDKNLEILNEIKNTNSVSIHLRLGDYINDPGINKLFGTCNLDYYHRSIDLIKTKIPYPAFFVFSDNIEWVKSNLIIDFPVTFVDSNHGEKSFEDLRLMSNCKHNIIANSSFSWWAAWLNNNPEKIVINPSRWVLIENYDTRDLIPEKWIKL